MERNLTDIHSARTYRCLYIAISRWSRQTPQGDTRGPVQFTGLTQAMTSNANATFLSMATKPWIRACIA